MRFELGRPLLALLLVAWTALLWWGLTSTRITREVQFVGTVYVLNLSHAGLFGVQAVLAGLLLRPGVVRAPRGPWLAAAVLAIAYSGWLEWRQGQIPGRSSSWADMLTNVVGALGTPWALARPRPLGARPVQLALVALGCAALATWTDL